MTPSNRLRTMDRSMSDGTETHEAERARGPRCPTCGAPVVWADNPSRPFCSVACKLIDLGGWLDEAYRVPGDPVSTEAREPEPPPEAPPGRR